MDQFASDGGFTYEIVEIPSFSGRTEALMSDQVDAVFIHRASGGDARPAGCTHSG